jgi:ketosteroid isomerase-like protein
VTWLSEDPWPLITVLGIVAAGCLIALKVTQQGKYLVAMLIALALAGGIWLVERAWVTDNERIEDVVYALGRAVARSDADAALDLMTPDVTLTMPGAPLSRDQLQAVRRFAPRAGAVADALTREAIRAALENARFDFLSITRVKAHAGARTRMGQAEFRVFASGTVEGDGVRWNFATDASGTDWAMGFREVDGRWKIESITAIRVPRNWQLPAAGR